jgi:predicted DsbA family dithiol-disulfide isomerase
MSGRPFDAGTTVEIEIYSDVVCPWCYLGRVRLDAALATFPGEVILRYRAFQLDPGTPREATPLVGWLARRFGGEERARATMAHVTSLAAAEGVTLNFDRALIANTFDAHRLLWFADQPQAVIFGATADTQPELALMLHRAHLVDGQDIASHAVLAAIADEAGLDPDRIRHMLATTEGIADVRGELARADDLGVHSVPTFIIDGRYALSGAQPHQVMRSVLDEVAQRGTTGPRVPYQRTAPASEDDLSPR